MHSTDPAHLIRIDLRIIGQIGYCEPQSCSSLNTIGSQLQASSLLLPSTFIISDFWNSHSGNYLQCRPLCCDGLRVVTAQNAANFVLSHGSAYNMEVWVPQVLRWGLDGWIGIVVQFPTGANDYFLLQSVQTGFSAHLTSYSMGHEGFLLGGLKRQGHETDRSPLVLPKFRCRNSVPPR